MPLIYIHGVRHREPEKLKGMEQKLSSVVAELRPQVPALCTDCPILVPYWGEFGAQPRFTGLLPLDAPVLNATPHKEHVATDLAGEASLDVLRDACRDDANAMRALLQDQVGQMSLTARERVALEALLQTDWERAYLAEHTAQAEAAGETARSSHERLEPVDPAARRDLVRDRSPAQRLVDLVERAASNLVMDQESVRKWMRSVQDNSALFLGDALAYVIQRESLGADSPILRTVLASLPPSGAPQKPLIVMTHSMGAAIFYDILTAFRPDLHVDCWISVGSQIGQFANLGLLAKQPAMASGMASGERIGGLSKRVHRWYNIFDRLDFLNYLTEPAFADVKDIEYANKRGPAVSHSWYFKERPFWDRVSMLIKEALTEGKHD